MFKERSLKKELLDADTIPEEDLYQNLRELDTINALLGGYKMTFEALKKILKKGGSYTLMDIGSGGGDTLKRIFNWNKPKGYSLRLFGIDLKQSCVNYAEKYKPQPEIKFFCDDYKNMYTHVSQIDILHACLFCHHLSEKEIIALIQFAQSHKSILIINDLQRNALAHYAIKYLTRLFSKSYLVKNDAPLSVLRGFKKKEWVKMIQQSGAKNYSITYKWAFRHEIIIYAD